MITKVDEYLAEVCKIGGFALIAPFGKVFLSIPYLELTEITVNLLLYFILTFLLASVGIIAIFKGSELLLEK